MVVEEGYSQGLDAFLSGKIDRKDLVEITKAILYYPGYIVPGVGAYRELKKPKSERSTLGIVISSIIAAGFVVKFVLLPAYIVGKGVITKNWHPFKFNSKEKTEQFEGISNSNKKRKNLENKTLKLDCFE